MENVPADNKQILETAGLTVKEAKGFGLAFILFNTAKAPFNKKEVRQAFFYAIDSEKLTKNNMSGMATPASSFLNEGHANYHKAKNVYKKDTEKAKKLLADAGVTNLQVTLLSTDHPWVSGMTSQIKSDLEAAGVGVTIQSVASSSLYADYLDKETKDASFDLALAPGDPSVFGSDPALLMNWWIGDNIWTQKRSQWKNSDPEKFNQLQAVINEAVTLTGAEQQKKWDEAQDILSEELPVYPLFHRTLLTAYNSKVTGFMPIAMTGLNLLGARLTK